MRICQQELSDRICAIGNTITCGSATDSPLPPLAAVGFFYGGLAAIHGRALRRPLRRALNVAEFARCCGEICRAAQNENVCVQVDHARARNRDRCVATRFDLLFT